LKYLLDTNAIIFLLYGKKANSKFSENAISLIRDSQELCLSIVSLWEIAIKKRIKKIDIDDSIIQIRNKCREKHIEIYSVKTMYLDELSNLENISNHKDPFDHLILSTAKTERMALISSDAKMRNYGNIDVIW